MELPRYNNIVGSHDQSVCCLISGGHCAGHAAPPNIVAVKRDTSHASAQQPERDPVKAEVKKTNRILKMAKLMGIGVTLACVAQVSYSIGNPTDTPGKFFDFDNINRIRDIPHVVDDPVKDIVFLKNTLHVGDAFEAGIKGVVGTGKLLADLV